MQGKAVEVISDLDEILIEKSLIMIDRRHTIDSGHIDGIAHNN